MLRHSKSILIDEDEAEFIDALEDFIFFDASNPLSVSDSSSVYDVDESYQDSVSKPPDSPESQSFTFSGGLRRRRLFTRRSSKEFRFKNSSDGVEDLGIHGSSVSPAKSSKLSWNLKDDYKLNDGLDVSRVLGSSGSVGKRLNEETIEKSVSSSAITTLTDDGSVNDRSVTVDSSNSGSNLLLALVRLIIKVVSFKLSLLVALVTFPIWLTQSSYMFVTDPFAIMRRTKRYAIRSISRFLNFCLGKVKRIVYKCVKRNKSICKFCLQVGWGLLWSAFVGSILVGLLVFAFVIGGALMKGVMEHPVRKVEQLNFDYTRDNPVAFVPIMSCPESFCLECDEKVRFGSVAPSRAIPPDHKLQANVLLTLPESDYNRNLGNFQVRLDFLSSNGKSLASATQPSTLQFKSWPIRLVMTVYNLAPLITGYSSESQTLDIKFNGYTEREIPTSCLRVVLEPRAEFAKGGGVPEIYSAYLKLNSQLPFLKRILWSWKVTVFVWTSIMVFTMGLAFMLLCCMPVFVPRLRLRGAGAPVNNTGSR